MNKIYFSLLLFFTVSFSFAQADQAYKNKVKLMMQASGGIEAYDAAISQLFTMYKQQSPEVPEKFWNEFEKEFSSTSMDELVSLLAPVYYRHLTAQDLDQIISFYATPAGKKLSASQPAITAESMSVGQEWGARLGERVLKKLKEKGY